MLRCGTDTLESEYMRERLQFLLFRGLDNVRGMTEQSAKKQQKYVHAITTRVACCCVVSLALSVCAHADVDFR